MFSDPEVEKPSTQPDVKELILSQDDKIICDTYIFEPSAEEEPLGFLFAVGEIEDRGGVGRELFDLIMTAVQKEYYRDPHRSVTASFELALHQANLILHDSAEQGVRDWMGYFHVAIGVLANTTLHVSVAGAASIYLVRKSSITNITEGLAVFPVTNPLRTFSQVATGTLAARDTLYFGTGGFEGLFRDEDLIRFAIDHSASTIATRLQQLYVDQGSRTPVAILIASLLPKYIVEPRTEVLMPARRHRADVIHQESLKPRQPIILRRSWFRSLLLVVGRAFTLVWTSFRAHAWPVIKSGSKQGTRVLYKASLVTGRGVKRLSEQQIAKLRNQQTAAPPAAGQGTMRPKSLRQRLGDRLVYVAAVIMSLPRRVWAGFTRLPRTSRIFASVALIFAIALIASLLLLQQKRANDAAIQQASELLHSARTKKEAAVTSLIYDNRDQARAYLAEAEDFTNQVETTGLYTEEVGALRSEIAAQNDRLQKVVRPAGEAVAIIGDFASVITQNAPKHIWLLGEDVYAASPETNAIVHMSATGEVSRITQTTQGIGFFIDGVAQPADKTIILATDAPGIALFDSADGSLHRQDISLPSSNTSLGAIATFGNRLYLLDQASDDVYTYNKTLRGFAGGEAWITDPAFPKQAIKSFAVDGNIFTLQDDGTIRRLFKGAEAEFVMEAVEPALTSATKIITGEDYQFIYVFDPSQKRVVVYQKDGTLSRQIFVDSAQQMADVAIPPAEDRIYVLDGTRVLTVPLAEAP